MCSRLAMPDPPLQAGVRPAGGRQAVGGGLVKVLALECSTEQAGVALLSDGHLVVSRPVETGRRRSQGLFDAVEALRYSVNHDFS